MFTKRIATTESVHISFIERLAHNFFNPEESWGRENRNQLLTGIVCTMVYLVFNFIFYNSGVSWKAMHFSSIGLIAASGVCIIMFAVTFLRHLIMPAVSDYPWYERYMPQIITLLGLGTLMALLNIRQTSPDDAALWINLVILLVAFIITAGYFIEGSNNEKVIKIWFSLLGYYFSVIVFFYFLESIFFRI